MQTLALIHCGRMQMRWILHLYARLMTRGTLVGYQLFSLITLKSAKILVDNLNECVRACRKSGKA